MPKKCAGRRKVARRAFGCQLSFFVISCGITYAMFYEDEWVSAQLSHSHFMVIDYHILVSLLPI